MENAEESNGTEKRYYEMLNKVDHKFSKCSMNVYGLLFYSANPDFCEEIIRSLRPRFDWLVKVHITSHVKIINIS